MTLREFLLYVPVAAGDLAYTITSGDDLLDSSENLSKGHYFAVSGEFASERETMAVELKWSENDEEVNKALEQFEEDVRHYCPDLPEEWLDREVERVFAYINIDPLVDCFEEGGELKDAVEKAQSCINICVGTDDDDEELWKTLPARPSITTDV